MIPFVFLGTFSIKDHHEVHTTMIEFQRERERERELSGCWMWVRAGGARGLGIFSQLGRCWSLKQPIGAFDDMGQPIESRQNISQAQGVLIDRLSYHTCNLNWDLRPRLLKLISQTSTQTDKRNQIETKILICNLSTISFINQESKVNWKVFIIKAQESLRGAECCAQTSN